MPSKSVPAPADRQPDDPARVYTIPPARRYADFNGSDPVNRRLRRRAAHRPIATSTGATGRTGLACRHRHALLTCATGWAPMAHDVFISYSSKDKPAADATCAVLESKGIRCWIAPRDIAPGSDWGEVIVDAIHASRAVVLVFSENANLSNQIKREVERAVNAGLPVIPLRIENVMPARSLEYFLSTPHWLDAFTP